LVFGEGCRLLRVKNALSLSKFFPPWQFFSESSPAATQSDCKCRLFAYTSDFWRPPSSRLPWWVAVCSYLYGVCLVVGAVFCSEGSDQARVFFFRGRVFISASIQRLGYEVGSCRM
jgi:hypothetical protein